MHSTERSKLHHVEAKEEKIEARRHSKIDWANNIKNSAMDNVWVWGCLSTLTLSILTLSRITLSKVSFSDILRNDYLDHFDTFGENFDFDTFKNDTFKNDTF